MEINEKIEDHERRIYLIEEQLNRILKRPQKPAEVSADFLFSDKKKSHNELLEELLKSDYCHSKNGISFEEVLEVFKINGRPVIPKKLRDLLAIWKNRKKIEAAKSGGVLRYFWIENG